MKNLTTFLARAAMLLLLAVFTTTPAQAADYIKDLMLIGAPSESEINTLKTTYQNQGWTVIDQDLNEGVDKSGRDYIYLLCKKESSNNINFGYITNLFLKEGNNPVDEFTESGHTYKLVPYAGGTQFVNNKGDLNSGAGSNSKYIYLYYSKDDSGTNDYCLIDIYFQTSQSSAAGALGLNGSWETGYDLNKGGGGAYIYLHANSNMAPAYTVTLYSGTPGNTSEYNFTYKTNNPNHVASSGSAAANCQFYRSGNDIYFKLEPSYDDILTPVSGYYFNGWGWGNGTHHKLTSVATSKTAQWIQGADLSKLSGNYTAQNGDLLTGTLAGNYKISIADGATVTLSGVTINGNDNNSNYKWAGINCLGNVTIILAEGTTNNVKGFSSQSGIYVKTGYTLTIKGQGTLNATGGSLGAGIGGANTSPAGNIVIESGIINAYGASSGAAGIGAGYELGASSGNITISGGTVTAKGGSGAAGIGAGVGSASNGPFCGNIIINGGTVYAYGGSAAAGIGSSMNFNCGNITITSGVNSVTAYKGNGATYSIGKGKYSNCGTITIGDLVTGDISLSPFETYPYTVTFNANGGTGTMTSLNLMNNVPQQLSNNTFAYTNLVFGEWNTQANGSGTSYANQQSVSSLTSTSGATVTLYAQWQGGGLVAGTAYKVTQDGSVSTATYTRPLTGRVGKHQAWFVPFDYEITSDDEGKFSFYKINMIANSPSQSPDATDEMWVFLKPIGAGTVLHANMPYVFKPKEDMESYSFTTANTTLKAKDTEVLAKMETMEDIYEVYGVYENTSPSASDPFYYVNYSGEISLGNSSSVTVGPYRWIIRKTNKFGGTTSYAREMHFFDGEEDDATGLNEELRMKNEESSEDWYTLDGVKLSGKPTQKGIYIHGGRKEAIR